MAAKRTAVREGDFPVAVYGLGKIGLPVAAIFAELTGDVVGVDTDPSVVSAVEDGHAPYNHEPGLDALLAETTEEGSLKATTDGIAAANEAAIHVIVVPVPLKEDNTVDLSALRAAADVIGAGLSPGDLVVVETTVPPGTCDEIVKPRLAEESGLDHDDFGVAACPERTSSGRALTDIRGAYPRIVGGVDTASAAAAYAVYDELVDNQVIEVSDARTAEAVKLFEGVYRDLNIALANELARGFDGTGFDVREAIEAANTQPYCNIHEPGAGVGGHCIPWYPYFLTESTESAMPLIETARSVNDSMPIYLAERTLQALRDDGIDPESARIAVLGLAYRAEIPETAASPTYPFVERLEQSGASVVVLDPVLAAPNESFEVIGLDQLETYNPDAIVLVTAHASFRDVAWEQFQNCVIIDGRAALDESVNRTYTVGSDP